MNSDKKTNRHGFLVKKYLFLFGFIFLFHTCFGQKTTGSFFIFKPDGSAAADMKEAAFLLHVFPLNDTTYLSRYYNLNGPMIRQESFSDSNLTIPNGRFCWYNSTGNLDSTGIVNKGNKQGNWLYIISKNETHSIDYTDGLKTNEQTFRYDDNGKYIMADSSHDEVKDDTQKGAVYKRGIKDWVTYCQKNLATPERIKNVLPEGIHTCTVSFLIDKQGFTKDIYLNHSCEWSGDAEVMRLIADSPQWQPAIQQGKPVFYRQQQSLSYQVLSR